jgi:hypothetical protein
MGDGESMPDEPEVVVEQEPEVVMVDESQLTPEQKGIIDEFRKSQAATSTKISQDEIKGWYDEMMEITPETFPAFFEKISSMEHDYHSTIHAAAVIGLASVKAFNRKVTFKDQTQGMRIANTIYASMTGIGDDPFRIFEFYTILDPTCDNSLVSIPKGIFVALRNKAQKLLEEHPEAPAAYIKRWKQVAHGKLPEPWIVREMN